MTRRSNSMASLHADQAGQASLEWVLLVSVFGLPGQLRQEAYSHAGGYKVLERGHLGATNSDPGLEVL
ncbi:MAG: hypothetical protein WCK05_12715, partial [Planctomycetota bacterium]